MTTKISGMPNRVEAERAIFSIILLDPDRFEEVFDKLFITDFYSMTGQSIWKAMLSLYRQGIDIDTVSINQELKRLKIDSESAIKELAQCYEREVRDSNLDVFIDEVKNSSLLRQIIKATNQRLEEAKFDNAKAIPLLADLEKDVIRINDRVVDKRPVDPKGILKELELDLSRVGSWKGFNTGFKNIDKRTGGLIPTHVWIIGAYTGTGKTFFVLQMMLNILEQGGKVVLFSTEMDRKMNMIRLLGNLAGVGSIKMLKGQLGEEQKAKVELAKEKLRSYKNQLSIFDTVYTVEEIRLKCKKIKLQQGVDVVVIDFLQNLRGASNIYERMSEAATDLQRLAQELNITMVLTSQVAQTSAGWKNKEAIEYKGAGEIAAVADVGLWISKEQGVEDQRKIYLRKVRHGAPGKQLVRLLFPSGRMLEYGEETEEKSDDGQVNF